MTSAVSRLGFLGRPKKSSDLPRPDSKSSIILKQIETAGIGTFWATDANGKFVYFSPQALADLALPAADVVGQDITSLFLDADSDGEVTQQRPLALKLKSRSKIEKHIVRIAASDTRNSDRWWEIRARPLTEEKHFAGYIGTAADVTEDVLQRKRMREQEKYDELTGLLNGQFFMRRLNSVLASFRGAQRSCALMVVDVDHFRLINERYGSTTADNLLVEISQRLTNLLDQLGELARVSGDQFRILIPDLDDRGQLGEWAERTIQLLSQPYNLNGRRITIDVSVGIAVAPYDALDAFELGEAVNLALASVKENRGAGFCLYSEQLAEKALVSLKTEQYLYGALERCELSLRYDPIVNLADNKVKGFQTELYWENSELGVVSPEFFWPMVEQSDAALSIGHWMLEQLCKDIAQWPFNYFASVRLPAKFLKQNDFRRKLTDAGQSAQIGLSRIELELSEDLIVDNVVFGRNFVNEMRSLGARAVVRDFGESQWSVGLLADLKCERVDISGKFLREWSVNCQRSNTILSAINGLTKALGLMTSIRPLEALDALEAVKACGIDLAQGPIFSAPLKQLDLLQLIAERNGVFEPSGPLRQRAERITLLRKIGLVHEDHYYDVLLKNISKTGAKIAGIAGVPVGTEVVLDLGNGQLAVSTVVNSTESSQGVRFETPLVSDGHGGLMTRHRISPYALAEAGLPLKSLGGDTDALAQWKEAKKGSPKFVQLQLSSV